MASSTPIKLEPIDIDAEREVVDEIKAQAFINHWTDQLRKRKATIPPEETTSEEVVLCDRIQLTGKSYRAEAAKIIATFLTDPFEGGPPIARGIVEARLDDIIASRLTEEGLEVLQTVCDAFAGSNLVDVDLSDNAIGEQGIGACTTVLSKKTLERLALCNNGLSMETMGQVADILVADEDGTGCIASGLTKIHFFNNMSGEGGAKAFVRILDKCTKLTDLRFASTRAGRAGSDMIASAFDASLAEGNNLGLVKLDLCDNNFNNRASYEALFRSLGRLNSLQYLDLRECDLEDDGVKKVCHALFECDSALDHFNLSGNGIEKRGAKHVAEYIKDCGGKLKVLRMEDNEMTSKGAEYIAAAFHSSEDGHCIEELQMNACMIGALGARAFIDACGPHGTDLPHLKHIHLNGNSFTEEVMGELEVAFEDKLGEMDDNDSDGDADDDLSEDEEEEEEEDGGAADGAVDDLAAAMEKSLVV